MTNEAQTAETTPYYFRNEDTGQRIDYVTRREACLLYTSDAADEAYDV